MVASPCRCAHILRVSQQPPQNSAAATASQLWHAGVAAVQGDNATRAALQAGAAPPLDAVLAVGKAASSMLRGALEFLRPESQALLITKYDHVDPEVRADPRVRVLESGHPMPDENSLAAGRAAIEFVSACDAETRLLVLVSGGASALVEAPGEGMDLADLRKLSDRLLSDGYSIDQINHVRIAISRIKGGRLLRRFPGREILALGISDIPGDDAGLIGSGIAALEPPVVRPFPIPDDIRALMDAMHDGDTGEEGDAPFRYRSRLVGSNRQAREAAETVARERGLRVVESIECLEGDVTDLAGTLASRIRDGEPGVYIWGGEPTVHLPASPGRGGRNQSLALALMLELVGEPGIHGVVAGTDGTDGPTEAAGGFVGPLDDVAGAKEALARADAGAWLEAHDRLFVTGPTGTNVMDLAVLIREAIT